MKQKTTTPQTSSEIHYPQLPEFMLWGRELMVGGQTINLDDLTPCPEGQYRPQEEIIVMGREILMGSKRYNVDELLSLKLSTLSPVPTSD